MDVLSILNRCPRILIAGALAVALSPVPLAAQAELGVWFGGAWGELPGSVVGATGRLRVAGPASVTLSAERFMASSACDVIPGVPAISCGYEGSRFAVGGSLAPIERDRYRVAVGADVGAFDPSSYGGSWKSALGISLDAGLRVGGPFWTHLRAEHRRIFDGAYRDVSSRYPRYTSVTLGAGVAFGGGG